MSRLGAKRGEALEHSAELLREADSNGAIFLALPANGPARNSINEQGSLLRTICAEQRSDQLSRPGRRARPSSARAAARGRGSGGCC